MHARIAFDATAVDVVIDIAIGIHGTGAMRERKPARREEAGTGVLDHAICAGPVDRERVGAGTCQRQVAYVDGERAAGERDRAAGERRELYGIAARRMRQRVSQTAATGVGAVRNRAHHAGALPLVRANVGGAADEARTAVAALI